MLLYCCRYVPPWEGHTAPPKLLLKHDQKQIFDPLQPIRFLFAIRTVSEDVSPTVIKRVSNSH